MLAASALDDGEEVAAARADAIWLVVCSAAAAFPKPNSSFSLKRK
jgi:hypothetical protein